MSQENEEKVNEQRKFHVHVTVQTYSIGRTAFEILADSEESAKKAAINYAKRNMDSINWEETLLTQRPRPKIESIKEIHTPKQKEN